MPAAAFVPSWAAPPACDPESALLRVARLDVPSLEASVEPSLAELVGAACRNRGLIGWMEVKSNNLTATHIATESSPGMRECCIGEKSTAGCTAEGTWLLKSAWQT